MPMKLSGGIKRKERTIKQRGASLMIIVLTTIKSVIMRLPINNGGRTTHLWKLLKVNLNVKRFKDKRPLQQRRLQKSKSQVAKKKRPKKEETQEGCQAST